MQTLANPNFRVYYLSEQAVTIEFGADISGHLLQQVSRFNQLVHQNPFIGFITTVPAYATLTVFYDSVKVSLSQTLAGESSFDKVHNYLSKLNNYHEKSVLAQEINMVTIPVCYGLGFGPDMAEVAALHNLTVPEVIRLHTEVTYTVYMIGFVPGFAYLGGMNELLATPRKATPRKAVPAGAVGIAGAQTGIYPLETPGGWQIIGQTPIKLFDAKRAQPSLLKAGDQVVFKPVTMEEYHNLAAQ